MNILEVNGLSVAYRKNTVLQNVSFSIQQGSLTSIVGPNGAGKSTLIKALLELHPKLSGRVSFFGAPLKSVKGKVGYVPQRGSVDWDFPTDALDVVLMGMYGRIGWLKWPNNNHKAKALEALDKVGMKEYANRQISELSGGQQQRVFLARALIQEADLYFMDEPLAGVDAATERAIMSILQKLRNEGKTVLVVHHDLQTVEDYFDQVLLLNRTVVAHGNTTSTFTPENIEETYGGSVRWLKEGFGIVNPTL